MTEAQSGLLLSSAFLLRHWFLGQLEGEKEVQPFNPVVNSTGPSLSLYMLTGPVGVNALLAEDWVVNQWSVGHTCTFGDQFPHQTQGSVVAAQSQSVTHTGDLIRRKSRNPETGKVTLVGPTKSSCCTATQWRKRKSWTCCCSRW